MEMHTGCEIRGMRSLNGGVLVGAEHGYYIVKQCKIDLFEMWVNFSLSIV
jgi:hypothetical protein